MNRAPTLLVTNLSGIRRCIARMKFAPEQCIGTTTSGLSASSSVIVCSIYSSGAGPRWNPPITACSFDTPDTAIAALVVLINPTCPHEVITTSPFP